MIREIMKNVLGFSSGMMIKMADFSVQNFSASISVSKHRSCSNSESRNAFSLDSAVDMTEDYEQAICDIIETECTRILTSGGYDKAIDGINELEKNVDSLIIINNEKIYKEYGELLIQDAFPKADEVLATAVRGITEIIKKRGFINVDFKDVKAMMTNSGMALMGCGTGSGENRIEDAVKAAMDSPLLNDFDIKTAKNVLINVTVGNNESGLQMKQLDEIDKMIKEYTGNANNFKRGIVFDDTEEFGDKVSITVIATGFKMARIIEITEGNPGNIIVVDSNFVYKKDEHAAEEGIELPEVRSQKIGYNHTAIRKRIAFEEGRKPALLVSEGEDKSELENTPAIKRTAGRNKE